MGMKKKYATDEEKRLAIRVQNKLRRSLETEEQRSARIAYGRAYYKKNKEKWNNEEALEKNREKSREYYAKNREKSLEAMKKYREKTKEKRKEYMAAYRKSHSEAFALRMKSDPVFREKRRACQLNVARKAREKITPTYAAKILKLNVSECSEELIEMKRQQLIVARQIRSLNKLLKETENG